MKSPIKLNENNLSLISKKIITPAYDRSKISTGIVHIGVGNFHRAHEAFYTDQLLDKNITEWGICGVGLLKDDNKMYNILKKQDGLYTLLVIMESEDAASARIIGSIVDYIYAPDDTEAVLDQMSDPEVKIISLTITEGGYNFDPSSGNFIFLEPSIQWDIKHPTHPKTVFGYLTQALRRRMNRGTSGLSILSCDNIQQNGDICKNMLLEYMGEADPELVKWVESNCSFPNSMVDRITPVTKAEDIELLKTRYGIEDKWPVVCEPFIQWVIEDKFSRGRPEWESVGVQFVKDVAPYERMKIRLLNAGHSLLGLSGTLHGYKTIDETVKDPIFETFLRKFMDEEVTPVLGKINGMDIEEYKNCLIQRFSNENIKDELSRICAESSAKIPKFLIPTIQEQLIRGGSFQCGALVTASWCRYLELSGTTGYNYIVEDAMYKELFQKAYASAHGDPLSFLKVKSVFGSLADSNEFIDVYIPLINNLRKNGIEETIIQIQ